MRVLTSTDGMFQDDVLYDLVRFRAYFIGWVLGKTLGKTHCFKREGKWVYN